MRDYRILKHDSHVFYVLQGKERKAYASSEAIRQGITVYYKNAERNAVISYLELDDPEYLRDNLNKNSIFIVIMPTSEGSDHPWWIMTIDSDFTDDFMKYLEDGGWASTYEAAISYVRENEEKLFVGFGFDKLPENPTLEEQLEARKEVIPLRLRG